MARGPKKLTLVTGGAERTDPTSLRAEIRNALLAVLRDHGAPAMAKASAGRTLIEMLRDDEDTALDQRSASEMSEVEIDEEIKRLKQHQQSL